MSTTSRSSIFSQFHPTVWNILHYLLFHPTEHIRLNAPRAVLNGQFGVTSAPVFLDNIACNGEEKTLLDCTRSSPLGLIGDSCVCTTQDDCVEDLGIICPGLIHKYCSLCHNLQLNIYRNVQIIVVMLLHSFVLEVTCLF